MDPADFRAASRCFERVAYLNAGSDGPLPAAAVHAAGRRSSAPGATGRTTRTSRPAASGRRAARGLRRPARLRPRRGRADHVDQRGRRQGAHRARARTGRRDPDLRPGAPRPARAAAGRARRAACAVRTGAAARRSPTTSTAADDGWSCCSHVGWVTGELADPRLARRRRPARARRRAGRRRRRRSTSRALGCPAYAGAGQKWLCGADGTGMLYLAPRPRAGRGRWRPPTWPSRTPAGPRLRPAPGRPAPRHADACRARPSASRSPPPRSSSAFGWDALYERAAALAAHAGRRAAPSAGGPSRPRAARRSSPGRTRTRRRRRTASPRRASSIRDLPGTPVPAGVASAPGTTTTDLDRLLEAL